MAIAIKLTTKTQRAPRIRESAMGLASSDYQFLGGFRVLVTFVFGGEICLAMLCRN